MKATKKIIVGIILFAVLIIGASGIVITGETNTA